MKALRRLGFAVSVAAVACGLTLCLPAVAWADDEAPKPAPRTTLQIGGVSIVLIAASDHLYAFVDRTEDNAPVRKAELGIDTADGTSLDVKQASEGLYVAPFNRAGHIHDAFMVSLESAEATGDAKAEIAYDDLPGTAGTDGRPSLASKLSIALVSGGIGAIGAALFLLWRAGRKLTAPRPVGTAQTV
jgi:hypothetical protein